MNDEIRQIASAKGDIQSIKNAAIKDGMNTLRRAAINNVVEGITTLEEAFRATAG